ncbi:MAG: helix-turn-helix domain-containing protein [Erythrobacter sp.]|jgi:hypothetical protein|nr:helix-turn-helix domain-containing protein [Erythrobacter sp.]
MHIDNTTPDGDSLADAPDNSGEGSALGDQASAGDAADDAAGDASDGGIEHPADAGATLRAARERRSLSLDHIAAETRIPLRHLETIEAGEFDDLPSRTYAIGFARTYARLVGLDESAIADKVREEMGSRGPRHPSVGQGMEPGDPAKLPSTGLAWFGGIAALILAVGVISYASTLYGTGDNLASLLPQDEGGQDAGEASDPAAPAAAADSAVQASADAAPDPNGEVVFTAIGEGAWVRFYEEGGERLFEDVMEAGDTFTVPADASAPFINTGRPNMFTITIGGKQVPPLADEMIAIQAPVSAAALLERDLPEDAGDEATPG